MGINTGTRREIEIWEERSGGETVRRFGFVE